MARCSVVNAWVLAAQLIGDLTVATKETPPVALVIEGEGMFYTGGVRELHLFLSKPPLFPRSTLYPARMQYQTCECMGSAHAYALADMPTCFMASELYQWKLGLAF
jgi:hypothetical protein